MKDFNFQVETKILFGDKLSSLSKEIKNYGSRVLICYGGGSIIRSGLLDAVKNELSSNGIEYFELSGIEPNPRVESAQRGIDAAKENNVDFILAVGGGSTIDCSKLIAAGAVNDIDPWEIVKGARINKALPLGTILTLSATGSEMDAGSVISNLETKEKLGWGSKYVLPKFSILNPAYTFTVPRNQTAAGTADIMSHTMENYFTVNDGAYLSNRFAESVLKTCIKYAPIAMEEPDNYEARANLMWAGTWAINGLLESGKDRGWSVHAMEHELSAFYDITHGVGLAILTPRWLKYVLNDVTVEKIREFGINVFGIEATDDFYKDANNAIDALYKFFESIEIPMHLKEIGIDETHLEEMAKLTIEHKGGIIEGFVDIDEKDVLEIYKMSL